jgi:hypothetical protein
MVTHGKAPTGAIICCDKLPSPAALFTDCFFPIYVPDTVEQRQRLGYAGTVFLIPDGFSCHVRNATEEVCVCYGIRMLAIPPHTLNQVQPLDLDLFAFYKSESCRVQPHLDLNAQTTKLIRKLCWFQTATTAVNVIAAFRRAQIVSRWDKHAKNLRCFSDRSQAAEIRH